GRNAGRGRGHGALFRAARDRGAGGRRRDGARKPADRCLAAGARDPHGLASPGPQARPRPHRTAPRPPGGAVSRRPPAPPRSGAGAMPGADRGARAAALLRGRPPAPRTGGRAGNHPGDRGRSDARAGLVARRGRGRGPDPSREPLPGRWRGVRLYSRLLGSDPQHRPCRAPATPQARPAGGPDRPRLRHRGDPPRCAERGVRGAAAGEFRLRQGGLSARPSGGARRRGAQPRRAARRAPALARGEPQPRTRRRGARHRPRAPGLGAGGWPAAAADLPPAAGGTGRGCDGDGSRRPAAALPLAQRRPPGHPCPGARAHRPGMVAGAKTPAGAGLLHRRGPGRPPLLAFSRRVLRSRRGKAPLVRPRLLRV
ncbi:MAG: DNA polymerase IV-like protein ImuB, partial [uncultured Microvirga sp.]